MSPAWGDVVARSRGLGTHLLTRRDLGLLADAPDIATLADRLAARGFLIPEAERSTAPAVELAIRRHAGAALRTLARWCDERRTLLAVVFEDEDRRSLRALLRGAAGKTPPEARLAGLIPTPDLPERALQELASLAAPRLIGATLAVWSNPYAGAIQQETTAAEPDLLRLDHAINRVWAERSLAHARGSLRTYVQTVIAIEHAYALLAAESSTDAVAVAFAPGRVPDALRAAAHDPEGPERAVLAALILDLHDEERRDPLSALGVVAYALRLRAQVLDLRRIVWGVTLGAPAGQIADALVTT